MMKKARFLSNQAMKDQKESTRRYFMQNLYEISRKKLTNRSKEFLTIS